MDDENNKLVNIVATEEDYYIFHNSEGNCSLTITNNGIEATEYLSEEPDEATENLNKIAEEMDEWRGLIGELSDVRESVKEEYDRLNNLLSDADRELTDFLHYLEISELSDEEALCLIKEIRDLLQYRREVKDCHALLGTMKPIFEGKEIERLIKLGTKCFDKIDNPSYTPRKRADLFVR